MRKAIILLSGGLDSTTTLAIAESEGFDIYALTFQYGQRHHFEIEAAQKIAHNYKVKNHKILNINLRQFGGSALIDDSDIPKNRGSDEIEQEIPITYVPARNTIFLSYALAWAEVIGSNDIFIGVNALDYSGYPDCRPEYIHAFENMAQLATKSGIEGKQKLKIHVPLINMKKSDIILKGRELGVDYSLTHTCYDPSRLGSPCGHCDACLLRLKGFNEAGLTDPLFYEKAKK